MLATVLTLALTLQQVTVKVGGEEADSARRAARRDSIRFESRVRTEDRDRRPVRRIPVTAEHERTAFRDSSARTLLLRAREARMRQDSSLLSYDATAYQRLSAGLGFRAIGRDRLLFRTENASRVQWSRANGVMIDLKGRRTAFPMLRENERREADAEMSDMSPIPYYPGREALWVGSGMARAEVDENELVHPIAIGAEAYYKYEAGDSLTITLSDGKVIRLRELRIEPRRPEWKFSVGSFWFDQESGQLVRAVYRFAAPMNIWAVAEEEAEREARERGRRDPDDEVPGWVKGMMSPMEANLEAVTIDYGLYGGRYWLPRAQYAEGWAKASFMRIPFRMEESFKYASVNGADSVPRMPKRLSMQALRDSLYPDSTPWRDLPPDERRARYRKLYEVDSTRRAEARAQREASCKEHGYYTDTQSRGWLGKEQGLLVRIPCDAAVLATSPELPASIYDSGEELFGAAERAELLKALDFGLQPVWAPMPVTLGYGLAQTRYNRVEGFSTAITATQQLGRGYSWDAAARMGTADYSVYAELGGTRSNGKHNYRLGGYRRLAVANNDWGSPLSFGASFGALFYGRDEGYYYRASGVELQRSLARGGGLEVRAFLERQTPAPWNTSFNIARALGGDAEFTTNINAERSTVAGAALSTQVSRGLDPLGWRLFGDARLEGGWLMDREYGDSLGESYARVAGDLTISRGFGPEFAAALTASAGYSTNAPLQRQFFIGGAQSVRGQLLGTRSGPVYWLGRAEFSRATGVVRPVVFGDVGWAGEWEQRNHPGRPISGAGVGASVMDGLIRMDLSRGIYPRQKMRLDLYVEARF
jgi:hypothetical protein